MTYDQIADELYSLPAGEFTAVRNEHVRRARQDGDRELARRIQALRKPTQAAWLVNLLRRERRDRFEELLELGESFREAYQHPSGDEMRQLSARRQQMISALSEAANELAEVAGVHPGAGTLRDVESTLEAALADPQVAESCRTGRLTEATAYAGFGPVAAGFPGTEAPPAPAPGHHRPPAAGKKEPVGDRAAARRQAAQERLVEAGRDADHTAAELAEREEAVEAGTARRDELREQVEDLRRELHHREQALSRAERDLRKAVRQRDRAATADDGARHRVERAEAALGDLR